MKAYLVRMSGCDDEVVAASHPWKAVEYMLAKYNQEEIADGGMPHWTADNLDHLSEIAAFLGVAE